MRPSKSWKTLGRSHRCIAGAVSFYGQSCYVCPDDHRRGRPFPKSKTCRFIESSYIPCTNTCRRYACSRSTTEDTRQETRPRLTGSKHRPSRTGLTYAHLPGQEREDEIRPCRRYKYLCLHIRSSATTQFGSCFRRNHAPPLCAVIFSHARQSITSFMGAPRLHHSKLFVQ